MSNSYVQIQAYQDYSWGKLGIWIRRVDLMTKEFEILGPEGGWKKHEIGVYGPPTFHLEEQHARSLAESLRAAGVRLESEIESTGHRAAVELHLSDMRRIASAKTGVPFKL